ncbi:hypothetical protein ACW2AE_07660, partial [Limosilactobacillus fermentum]
LVFNSKLKFNTPVGVAGYSDGLKNRQLNFIPKTENIELINGSYANLKISKMNKNTVFYFIYHIILQKLVIMMGSEDLVAGLMTMKLNF